MKPYKSIRLTAAAFSILLPFLTIAIACTPAAPAEKPTSDPSSPPISLTVLHVGDTHSYVIPHDVMLKFNGKDTLATLGGWSLLMSAVEDIRSNEKNVMLLHAGDIIQGTIWTHKFEGLADCDAMNTLQFNAIVPGNQDFSRSPQEAANLYNRLKFPVLAANVDASKEPELAGVIRPYSIMEFEGQKVGIIGLATPETATTDYPGKNIVFLPTEVSARKYVTELAGQGINKIIILSHLGYESDVKLAGDLAGIYIIVGGHSHTFMGGAEFEQIGLKPNMPYPTELKGPTGDRVLIVHAWAYNRMLGQIKLDFDEKGKIKSFKGQPFIYTTNGFQLEDSWGWNHLCPCRTEYGDIMEVMAKNPELKIYWDNPDMARVLQPYINQASSDLNTVVAVADENLIRGLNSGPGPIVADAFLWSARKANPDVRLAIFDSYFVRSDLYRGNILYNSICMLLPLRQNLVTMKIKGGLIKTMLESGIDSHMNVNLQPPCYEISGFTAKIDMMKKSGERVTGLQVRIPDGRFENMDMDGIYTIVSTDYMVDKGISPYIERVRWMGPLADNIESLIKGSLQLENLGIKDVDAMTDYLKVQKGVKNIKEERTVLVKPAGK